MDSRLLACAVSFAVLLASSGCVVYDKEGNIDHAATREVNESVRSGFQAAAEGAATGLQAYSAAQQGYPAQQAQPGYPPQPANAWSGNVAPPQGCSMCGGYGRVRCPACSGFGRVACNGCGGSGFYFGQYCGGCGGQGGFVCATCGGGGAVPCPNG